MDRTPKTPPEGKHIQAGSDCYYVIEQGAGDPVLFLHGGGPGCTAWSDFGVVAPLFAQSKRCVMPDLLQYGQSSKATITGPMWTHHAASITRLMDAVAIEQADFVCNSWGGSIALCLAAEHPERVRSLTITGSMPVFYGPLAPLPEQGRRGRNARDAYYGGTGPSQEKMRQLIERLEWYDVSLLPEETVSMRYKQSLNAEEMALAAHSDNPRGEWQDLTKELAQISAPVLFCWGLQDAFLTPDYPMMLTAMVQRGQLHILDACSHHLQEERPKHYYSVVNAFLNQPHSET